MPEKPSVPAEGYPSEWPTAPSRARRRALRLGTAWLTAALLALWAAVTFGVSYFARELSFDFFGWPFSFWVGSQGALIVYVLIVWTYARVMNRREAQARAEGAKADAAPR